MPSLEYIVRPYQSPNSRGQIIIPSTPQNTRQKATLTWGAKTDAKQFTVNVTLQKNKEDWNETNRDTETVRITGVDPDDDSPPYIDVERSKKLYFDKTATQQIDPSDPQMTQSDYTPYYTDYQHNVTNNPDVAFYDQYGQNITQAPDTATTNSKATMTLKNNTTPAAQ